MEKQICELCPEIKDCYWIDETGKIINKKTGNVISWKKEKNGYYRVSLMKIGGGTILKSVHKLVLMAFNPNKNQNKLQVNHKDGNKYNNNLENLEWVTAKQNIQHSIQNNLTNFDYLNGEGTNFNHYTEEQAKTVIELLKTNKYTDKEISKITGLPVRSFIAKIRRKETWKYLTKDIITPLGKAERKTFSYK